MPVDVGKVEFERLVEEAIAGLPEAYRVAVAEDVPVQVAPRPSPDQLESLGMDPEELLLGLYEGVPLPDRGVDAPAGVPDRIWLFREDIQDVCEDRDHLVREVRITLLHELGHYFGLDEDDLDELGYA
jgi:predicted Zn-dependent protease with MMP-like domain